MSKSNPVTLPQGPTAVIWTLKIADSRGATARIGTQRLDATNFAGSVHFCRPHS